MTLLKHWTASVFVFGKHMDGWKIVLIHHRKLGKWMIPGGHLEEHENPQEAAIREAREETGLDIKLHSFRTNTGYTNFPDVKTVLLPEYIIEEIIPAYGDEPEHIHIDCLYIGLVYKSELRHNELESHGVGWYSKERVEHLDMFPSTKIIALSIMEKLYTQCTTV